MPRNVGSVIQNNLSRGVITEATGLNFPDNAAVDALNVTFDPVGSVRRRKGFDIEGEALTKTYSDSDGLIKEFVWQSVARSGGFTFLVLQTGSTVVFYELTSSDALSAGINIVGLDLNQYKSPGAGDLRMTPCTFASGAGFLFIAHPMCNPIIVRWNEDTQAFEAALVKLRIRDFEGVEDTEALLTNPVNLTTEHHYNLRNQGWDQIVRIGSTSNEMGEGGNLGGLSIAGTPLDWTPLIPVPEKWRISARFGLGGSMTTNVVAGAAPDLGADFSLGGLMLADLQVLTSHEIEALFELGGSMTTNLNVSVAQPVEADFELGGSFTVNLSVEGAFDIGAAFELGGSMTTSLDTVIHPVVDFELGGSMTTSLEISGNVDAAADFLLGGSMTINLETVLNQFVEADFELGGSMTTDLLVVTDQLVEADFELGGSMTVNLESSAAGADSILLESGDNLLLENNDLILLE